MDVTVRRSATHLCPMAMDRELMRLPSFVPLNAPAVAPLPHIIGRATFLGNATA